MNESIFDVANSGSGYGTFTIPATKLLMEKTYAFDIEPEMIEIVKGKAKKNNLNNILPDLKDFMIHFLSGY